MSGRKSRQPVATLDGAAMYRHSVAERVRLAAENAQLRANLEAAREALLSILADSEDEFDGECRYRPERIPPARAVLARLEAQP